MVTIPDLKYVRILSPHHEAMDFNLHYWHFKALQCPWEKKNLWKICCDLVRYDGLGSEECFGSELQGWEVRRCCSSLQDRNLTTRLWARVLFPTDIRSVKPVSQNISRFAIVAYHKSGASLSYVIATLPELSLLLLGRGFRNFGWAKSYSTRHIPTYQGGVYLQTHRSLLQRVITYWLSPMEMMREEISSNYLVPGLGKAVHMVRKPSDMVVSGYLYHIRSREAWQTLTDPPNCDACDHQAWKNIFSTSNFNCSYEKLLRRSSMEDGVKTEIARSSWDMLKMMYNMKSWKGRRDVLSVSLSHFSNDFDATVRCIVLFLLDGLQPQRVLRAETLQSLLVSAREAGQRAKKTGRRGAKRGEVEAGKGQNILFLLVGPRRITRACCECGILAFHRSSVPLFLSWRSSSAPPDYSTLHFIAVWAWKLLNEDLLQKYIP